MPKQTTKVPFKTDCGSNYLFCLQEMLPNVQTGTSSQNRFVVPFTLTCAAALEAVLNDAFIDLAVQRFGHASYRKYAEHFLKMSPKAKLELLVPFATHFRYALNTDHVVYHQLNELVTLRNKLVHDRSFLRELEVTLSWPDGAEYDPKNIGFEFPKETTDDFFSEPFFTVTAEKARKFFESINSFREKVVRPAHEHKIDDGEFVVKLPYHGTFL